MPLYDPFPSYRDSALIDDDGDGYSAYASSAVDDLSVDIPADAISLEFDLYWVPEASGGVHTFHWLRHNADVKTGWDSRAVTGPTLASYTAQNFGVFLFQTSSALATPGEGWADGVFRGIQSGQRRRIISRGGMYDEGADIPIFANWVQSTLDDKATNITSVVWKVTDNTVAANLTGRIGAGSYLNVRVRYAS